MTIQQQAQQIIINPIKANIMKVKVGNIENSTLITHRLAPEIVEKITRREIGKADKKELRSFDKEYESSFYYTKDKKYGFPAGGFMGAILDAAVALDIPKTKIKRAIRVLGDIYELTYKKVNRRIDNPRRCGRNSAPDERHRPEFVDWTCDLIIQYDTNQITPDQIINLINQAGFSCGIGDWRPGAPNSSGIHGMFKVLTTK